MGDQGTVGSLSDRLARCGLNLFDDSIHMALFGLLVVSSHGPHNPGVFEVL